jgi:hypothetical protein
MTTMSAPAGAKSAAQQMDELKRRGLHEEIIRLAWDLEYKTEELVLLLETKTSAVDLSELLLQEANERLGPAEVALIRSRMGKPAPAAHAAPAPASQAAPPRTGGASFTPQRAPAPTHAPATGTTRVSGGSMQTAYRDPSTGAGAYYGPTQSSKPAIAPAPPSAFPWPAGLGRGLFADLSSMTLVYVLWRVDAYFMLVALDALGLPIADSSEALLLLLNPLTWSFWLLISLSITIVQRVYWPKTKNETSPRDLLDDLLMNTLEQQGATPQDRLIWAGTFGSNVLTTVVGMGLLLFGGVVLGVSIPAFGANWTTVLLTPLIILLAAGLALGPEWLGGMLLARLWRRLRLMYYWAKNRWNEYRGRRAAARAKNQGGKKGGK